MTSRVLMLTNLALGAQLCLAGYRNVDDPAQREAERHRETATAQDPISAEAMRPAEIVRKGRVASMANRGGRSDQMTVDAGEEFHVTLTRPDLPRGASVFAYTVHGGRINGTNVTTTLTVGEGGDVSFSFTAGRFFGNYPVVLRHSGREQVVNFWVKEARLTP